MAQTFSAYADTIRKKNYAHDIDHRTKETWEQSASRVAHAVFGPVKAAPWFREKAEEAIANREFMPGGRYLYASGRDFHQVQNCNLFRAEDSREGWSELNFKCLQSLMTGAGIGTVYSDVRPEGKLIRRTGGRATGPIALMNIVNEGGRFVMQGGARRSAIWAGLHWWHEDVFKFIRVKDWSDSLKKMKVENFAFPAPLDGTNISVILDREFFDAYHDEHHPRHVLARQVYWEVVHHMCETGEPGFSIDYEDANECLRNACTEITSADDSDICNLGSINMARVKSLEHMLHLVRVGTAFLLAGTVYSHVPFPKVDQVRGRNRRLGLGLMGIAEWLMVRGKPYGPDEELRGYLELYAKSTDVAHDYARMWDLTPPKKTRAIAPNGTISIVAETTGGVEPIFCKAYKRRYMKGRDVWEYQNVVDPTAKRAREAGILNHLIEDAYDLARDVERRVKFQVFVQKYVDHGISSTVNLPSWGSEYNNERTTRDFGDMLISYLPNLRGITCYPDGARGGQPFTAIPLDEALATEGQVFVEQGDVCIVGKGGACGD